MRYFGGKSRTAKYIVQVLKQLRKPNQLYIEPFIGGAWIFTQMDDPKIGCDANESLISLWTYLKDGGELPETITEEEYQQAKSLTDTDPLKAFIGFGCSFGGKWFGGYARDSKSTNYAKTTKNSLLRKIKTMEKSIFICEDYRDINPKNSLVYCDPPYQGTTQYGAVGSFNSDEFWEIMRKWSQKNTVVISEYQSPKDFKTILDVETNLNMNGSSKAKEKRIERLFMYGG